MMASSSSSSDSRGNEGQAMPMVKPKSHDAQTESSVDITKVLDVAEYNIPEICVFPIELKRG